MPIIHAYLMPHPPLAVPEVGGGRELQIAKTTCAMDEAASEIARLEPDTVIYFTPHGTLFRDYFHVSDGQAAGDLAQFGAPARIESEYDTELIAEISRICEQQNIPAGRAAENAPLDHGVTVPMYYINRQYTGCKTVRIAQSGLSAGRHFDLGRAVCAAADSLGRRAVVIASGDLSHKLADSGPYGYSPEGAVFDRDILQYLREWDVDAILRMDGGLRAKAAECAYGSIVMLAGCLDGMDVTAKQLSYEGPFGVGYAVVSFTPTTRANDDPYRNLARRALEHWVKTNRRLPLPPGEALPAEMLSKKAGAFVSLHKDGLLRGCIGTIAPTTGCIAEEIIRNAVSAGCHDSRFHPVELSELPLLTYKVDILDEPEEIAGADMLDVRQYGVIVESGYKRGLLLPNLDGIDSVEQQISIARQKAGISGAEPVMLKRFKVTRYG